MSEFYMKVAGVTFEGRQRVVAGLTVGQPLRFEPDPNNPHDSSAVKIVTEDGTQVGFVARDRNSQIFDNLMNHRGEYRVSVSAITGGGFGSSYGCNIKVVYMQKPNNSTTHYNDKTKQDVQNVSAAQEYTNTEKKILPIFAGASFDFGRYPYEATGEIKPIRWKVWALSPQNKIAILISEKIIDAKPFHSEFSAVSWTQSSLCNWLNRDFLNNAFSLSEQLVLVAPYGDALKNILVAIPDISDVKNIFPTEDVRKCIVTPYATRRGAWTEVDTGCGAWWVNRTGNGYAAAVNPKGVCNENEGIAVDYDDIGVRPMIVLSYEPPEDDVNELYGISGYVKIPATPAGRCIGNK